MPHATLVTGASSTLGALLTRTLREHYGADYVIAADVHGSYEDSAGPCERFDPLSIVQYETIARKYQIRAIFHISGTNEANVFFGEKGPWDIELKGLLMLLEFAKTHRVRKICCPLMDGDPLTIAGIATSAAEQWCNYYRHQHRLDVRVPKLYSSWTSEQAIRTILLSMKY